MDSGFGLLAISVLFFAGKGDDLTLQQVLKANTAAINSIRSIHVTMEISRPGEERGSELRPGYRLEWYKDSGRERERLDWLQTKNPQNSDITNGPDGFKQLQDYDASFRPALSESIARPAMGTINKTRTDGAVGSRQRAQCFMDIVPGPSLEEHVVRYPASKLAATPATSKFGCYEITTFLELNLGPGKGTDEMEMRVFVDPAAAFWIRRVENGGWKKSTAPGDKGVIHMQEVQEFKDCGNGIFFPMRARNTVRVPGKMDEVEISSVRFTLHSLNKPLPDEDFAIHFPDWLRVSDDNTGKLLVWGPNDQPRLTFASEGEYLKWYEPRAKEAFMAQSEVAPARRMGWIALANIVLVTLLVLFVWRRNRRRVVVSGVR